VASIRWRITKAVQSVVQTVLKPTLPLGRVYVRKRLQHDKSTEQQRSAVIVGEKERPGEQEYGGWVFVDYPVLVALIQGRGIEEPEAQWEADSREAVWHALFTPGVLGVSVPTVFDVDYDANPGVSAADYGDSYDVSVQRFTFRSREQRTG
jgi:hypothetical protein